MKLILLLIMNAIINEKRHLPMCLIEISVKMKKGPTCPLAWEFIHYLKNSVPSQSSHESISFFHITTSIYLLCYKNIHSIQINSILHKWHCTWMAITLYLPCHHNLFHNYLF